MGDSSCHFVEFLFDNLTAVKILQLSFNVWLFQFEIFKVDLLFFDLLVQFDVLK